MKKNIYLALSALVTLLSISSCTDKLEQKGSGDNLVYRTYISSISEDTKTSIQEEGAVDWSKGDLIRYYSSDRGNIGTFAIEEDCHSASINVQMSKDDDYLVAVYGGGAIENNTRVGFSMSGVAEAVQDGSFSKAHISVARTTDVTSGDLCFSSIVGIIQFSISQPGVEYVKFTSGDGTRITGDGKVEITFTKQGINTHYSSDGGGDCIRTEVDGTGTFYLSTLPCSIEGFRIELYDINDTKVSEVSSGKTLSLVAGTIVNLGAIDNMGVINSSYVPIDWASVVLTGYSDDSDTFTMSFSGQVPDIKIGSVLSVDADTTCSIRIVKDVNVSGNTVRVTTITGNLCDIFANTTLVLTTESNPSYVPTKGIDGENVIYARPIASVYQQNGRLCRQSLNLQTKGNTEFQGDLLTWEYDISGKELWKGDGFKLSLEKSSFLIDVDLSMSMNFGGRNLLAIIWDGYKVYRSKALSVTSYLTGDFNTTQILRFEAKGSIDKDIAKTLKKNFFPPKGKIYLAGYVPIYVEISGDLCLDTHLEADGEMNFMMGFTDNAIAKIGFNWSQMGEVTPITFFSNKLEYVPATIDARGSVNSKIWLYPKFNIYVDALIGPTFAIKPYLSTSIGGGLHTTLEDSGENYSALSVEEKTGVNVKTEVTLNFLGEDLKNYDVLDWSLLPEKLLFSSPAELVFDGDSDFKAVIGQSHKLSFTVKDYDGIIDQNVVTHLPQIVKFTGDGYIGSNYGVCKNGKVTVDWTPRTDKDVLKAALYSVDGKVIDECKVTSYALCPDNNHVHAVDLGLSVKWACCNVGASKPEESGGYYAWGETKEKSVYDDAHYQYAHGPYYFEYDDIGTDISGTQYDVAHVMMGGNWRMPSTDEYGELFENCDFEYTSMNGVVGVKFTSRKNGHSIFMPASGIRLGTELISVGLGFYWSSSLSIETTSLATYACIASNTVLRLSGARYFGVTIRAVSD